MPAIPESLVDLALFRKFAESAPLRWPTFLERRRERLTQATRNGKAAEKVAENILEDFFTVSLDWKIEELNNQVRHTDIILTHNGIKRLIVEAKYPGSLTWERPSLERALSQARRYADELRVKTIAVSDGALFYAADIANGGLCERARLSLDGPFSLNGWWLSVDGIYRDPELIQEEDKDAAGEDDPIPTSTTPAETDAPAPLLHHKYKIPAECFAYVGDATDTYTWKLPCWLITGEVDTGRLPGAIRAVLSTYRGTHVVIPESAVPDVLVRLGQAAAKARKLPKQTSKPLSSYEQLYDALYQLGRLSEVLGEKVD